jgi:hypothetical protein
MCFIGGMFIIGKHEKVQGMDTLKSPLVFLQGNNQIALSPLPDLPDSIDCSKHDFIYPVKEGQVKDLYIEATTQIKIPKSNLVKMI